ncbi:MAG: hypothetical protein PVF35_05660, partial [Gammaproteobacteria bacterium]
ELDIDESAVYLQAYLFRNHDERYSAVSFRQAFNSIGAGKPLPSKDQFIEADCIQQFNDCATLSTNQLDKTGSLSGFDVTRVSCVTGALHHFRSAFALETGSAQQYDLLQCFHKSVFNYGIRV